MYAITIHTFPVISSFPFCDSSTASTEHRFSFRANFMACPRRQARLIENLTVCSSRLSEVSGQHARPAMHLKAVRETFEVSG